MLGVAVYYQEQDRKEWGLTLLFIAIILALTLVLKYKYIFVFIFAIILIAVNKVCDFKMPKIVSKIIDVLDEYSYSLYLGHALLFCAILDKHVFSFPVRLLIATVGTAIVVITLHLLLEKPIQALFNKKQKKEKV